MHFAFFIKIFQRNSNIHGHALLNNIYFSLFFFIKRILKFLITLIKIELSTQVKHCNVAFFMIVTVLKKLNIIYHFHVLILN